MEEIVRIIAKKLQVTYVCPCDSNVYIVEVSSDNVWYEDFDDYSSGAVTVVYDILCPCGGKHEVVHNSIL